MALKPPEQKPKLITNDTKSQQKKSKHPEGLKGKEIGMYYAKKGKNTKKTPMSEWVSQGIPQGSMTSTESKQGNIKFKFAAF